MTSDQIFDAMAKDMPELRTGLFNMKGTLLSAFLDFHAENPHVYDVLAKLARRAKSVGYTPGIGCLFEVMRYMRGLETNGDPWKLNNNLRAYYARALMACEPDLRGFFSLRDLRSIE